jgi:stearoyl-CoA desaturase (delta-9 desaturase)
LSISVSRLERYVNLTAVFLPLVGIAVAVPLLWGSLVSLPVLILALVFYLLTGFGITIGYHRLMTHRSFATHKVIENGLALAGALALQGSPGDWVADHRKHHAFTDQEGDPHSPHAGQGAGISGALHGLWHAHVGWLWTNQGQAEKRRYAPELVEDRWMRSLHRHYLLIALASLAIPAALGGLITGSWLGVLTGLIWAGFVRIALLHHITWSVNSVCHFFGRRRFALEDHSTNVAWLALPSLGEAWHHNHHAFSRSAFHGLRPTEALLDPTGWIIRLMSRTRLAWNVVSIAPARQLERVAPSSSVSLDAHA